MSLDLGSLDTIAACSEGAECELVHPANREPLGIFITVLGPDSPEYREAQHKGQSAAVRSAQRNRQSIDFAALEARAVEVLARCTKGWRSEDEEGSHPVLMMNGNPLEFSRANASLVYTQYPWIKEQVDAFTADRGNFIKG